ncbi:MAG: FN3 associated domain-containing protein, partial [Planctomycetota bacterium]
RKVVKLPQPEPELTYKNNGFRADLLSDLPPVGAHPRVVMSPSDIPLIRVNIERYAVARKAWEDVLLKKIQPDKKAPTAHPWEGIYALVTENDEYGRKAAAALVARAAEVGKKIDEVDATHPYPAHWWFKIRGCGIQNVARAYDYLYDYMSDDQRDEVRKVISKGTVGRYNHGMELPRSWRTWNWPHFSQNIVNAALAIEGEEGYEPRIYDVCREAVVDFLTYKISPGGYDHESTGYNAGLVWGGGGSESLIAVARRLRDPNPLTHPHLQSHADSSIGQQGGPDGPWFGRGDASGSPPGFVLLTIMKYFYPEDPRWDLLWQSAYHRTHWDGSPGRFRGVDNRTGDVLPFLLMYGVEARKGPDGKPVNLWTKDAPFSLTYTFPKMGHLTTRTSWDGNDSVHMTLSAIAKMTNTGHDGPDEGTFSIWAHGVDWSRQGDKGNKYTPWRASIAVDGKGQYYGVAPGLFLPVVDAPLATAGVVDVTYSYTWHLRNGRYNVLYSPLFEEDPTFYTNKWSLDRVKTGLRKEELDPTPFSREFWKFAGTNYGLWMGEDRHPTMRYLNTPLRRAFRSVDLVRGEHPYVLVIDDIQKDDEPHLYDWIMPLAARNEMVRKAGERDERAVELLVRRIPALGRGEKDPGLKKGDPVLLVRVLNRNCNGYPSIRFASEVGAGDASTGRQRVIVPSVSVAPDFKILIYPHRHGDPLPATSWNEARSRLTVEIGEQVDTVRFATTYVDRRPFGGVGEHTLYGISRGGKVIQTVGGAPSVPRFVEGSRDFVREYECAFAEPTVGQEIRYTLNGTEPEADSPLYGAPLKLDDTTTVKAATFAPHWQYGPTRTDVATATYTKVRPEAPDAAHGDLVPGVELTFYELPVSI